MTAPRLTEEEALDLLSSRETLPTTPVENTFEITFTGKRLGIFVRPGNEGKNAVVDRITSDYAWDNDVRVLDRLIGINGKDIVNLPFNHITRIVQSVGQPVNIRFIKGPRTEMGKSQVHHHNHRRKLEDGEMS